MRFDNGTNKYATNAEQLNPEYKISFWTSDAYGSWAEEYWLITEADADEVIRWAQSEASGRYFVVWARNVEIDLQGVVRAEDVRLLGWEPTDSSQPPEWVKRHGPGHGPATPTEEGMTLLSFKVEGQ